MKLRQICNFAEFKDFGINVSGSKKFNNRECALQFLEHSAKLKVRHSNNILQPSIQFLIIIIFNKFQLSLVSCYFRFLFSHLKIICLSKLLLLSPSLLLSFSRFLLLCIIFLLRIFILNFFFLRFWMTYCFLLDCSTRLKKWWLFLTSPLPQTPLRQCNVLHSNSSLSFFC